MLLFVSLFRCWPEQRFYNNSELMFRQLHSNPEFTLSLVRTAPARSHYDEITRSFNPPLLWALFIRAVVEVKSNNSSGPTQFLAHELHLQLQRMELTTWSDAEAVLGTFVYSEMLLPPSEAQRNHVLGPFRGHSQQVTNSYLDVVRERPGSYHEADFVEFWNRSEALGSNVMQLSTDMWYEV